jgi:hypothetical protein
MPRPGTVDQYDEYEQNPLDYCFLFDAQNINGGTLDDLQAYKKHAADCVYASSISRLHKRLNSSEDNTILERCAQNGRNRYCGVGTAKLYYPDRAVCDYVALNWMRQAMTEDWLRYDNKVATETKRRLESRKRGVPQPNINERELYCQYVSEDESKNYFGVSIHEETHEIDRHGMVTSEARWDTYLKNLDQVIEDNSQSDVGDNGLGSKIAQTKTAISTNRNATLSSSFEAIASGLKVLFFKTKKMVETNAAVTADSLFSVDNFDANDESRIEYYLMRNGVPIHPNAARHFLYKLEAALKEKLQMLDAPNVGDDSESNWDGDIPFSQVEEKIQNFFTDKVYGDPSAPMTITRYASSLRRKSFKNEEYVKEANRILDDCQGHIEDIQMYYSLYVKVAIVRKALAFIDDLCKNYEIFYGMLADEIKGMNREIARIEDTYVNRPGNPVINVCSSPNCLKAVLEACPNTIDSIQLTEEFKISIFDAIYKNSSADAGVKTRQQRQIIEKLVSTEIKNFWREAVLTQYGRKVDMDIIQALCAEAEYEDGCTEIDELHQYVEKKYREALTLSDPFIDLPTGQPYKIQACGMSANIEDPDDAVKSAVLKIFGHYEKDSLMDKNQILVMIALYNLKASDLKKFASSDPHPADPRAAGAYFKDYNTRINNILPDSEKSNIITPHLDRRWHFTGVLPDFEDKTEIERQVEAQKAFLIALAYKYVRFDRDQYKFVNANGDFISEQIVVQDGLCDKLHEVYDAMSISRPLVRDFLNRFQESSNIEMDVKGLSNLDYTHSQLYKALNQMHFNKYDWIPTVTLMEIPLLYKTSVGNGSFDDDDAIAMLHNFIDMVDEYLALFYHDHIRRSEYLVRWLDEQTQKMFNNIANYYSLPDNVIIQHPYKDTLLSRMMNNITGKFNNLSSTCDYALECFNKYTKLWTDLTKN